MQTFSVSPEIRMLYNPQLKGAPNFVPELLHCFIDCLRDDDCNCHRKKKKETGTMEILLVSPMKPQFIIISKAIPYFYFKDGEFLSVILF